MSRHASTSGTASVILSEFALAIAARLAAARVQSLALRTDDIHGASKELGDEAGTTEDHRCDDNLGQSALHAQRKPWTPAPESRLPPPSDSVPCDPGIPGYRARA